MDSFPVYTYRCREPYKSNYQNLPRDKCLNENGIFNWEMGTDHGTYSELFQCEGLVNNFIFYFVLHTHKKKSFSICNV